MLTWQNGEFGIHLSIRWVLCRVDNQGTEDRGPQPVVMSVPEEGATLTGHRELVDLRGPKPQRALGYVGRPVCPVCQKLKDAMPTMQCNSINQSINQPSPIQSCCINVLKNSGKHASMNNWKNEEIRINEELWFMVTKALNVIDTLAFCLETWRELIDSRTSEWKLHAETGLWHSQPLCRPHRSPA